MREATLLFQILWNFLRTIILPPLGVAYLRDWAPRRSRGSDSRAVWAPGTIVRPPESRARGEGRFVVGDAFVVHASRPTGVKATFEVADGTLVQAGGCCSLGDAKKAGERTEGW
ncbi:MULTISPECIES: hypothetical protein [Streptomyces]|uniref:hypothetical protein n=1 Tax=Streptomyces TaxID=1883 RepID=UPI001238D5CF|nr:hypothetical protein [Streptomyces filamentosus]